MNTSAGDPRACRVCRRGEPPVCPRCRDRIAEQLTAVPALVDQLPYALVPSPGRGGERVTASREAPLPLRLDTLNLVAGGSDDVRCAFAPKVAVRATVVETTDLDGTAHPVTVWEREPVYDANGYPVMVLVDDQIGTLPVATWCRGWATDWRREFGHTKGPVVDQHPAPVARSLVRPRLGLGPALPYVDRPLDPLVEEWNTRWDQVNLAVLPDWRYLRTYVDHACDGYSRIGDFAASLRTLVGALKAVTGEKDDLEYLGRCPDTFTDRDTGAVSVCGASLWHDAQHATITCSRCLTETGQDRWLSLTRRILDAWPLDRRRCYSTGLVASLRIPACQCGGTLDVEWVHVPRLRGTDVLWRVGTVTCSRCEGEVRV